MARRFTRVERNLMDDKDEKKIQDEELDKVSGGTGPHEGQPHGGRGIDPQDHHVGGRDRGIDPAVRE
jgi:hypothetical protein